MRQHPGPSCVCTVVSLRQSAMGTGPGGWFYVGGSEYWRTFNTRWRSTTPWFVPSERVCPSAQTMRSEELPLEVTSAAALDDRKYIVPCESLDTWRPGAPAGFNVNPGSVPPTIPAVSTCTRGRSAEPCASAYFDIA